ncbi:cache domain-containing protein [Spongiibacter sp. KMU-158]|uniref:histidine kinase n=2 Tax=Spongiibacter pelagi TaxID=2760804 RepID=A0A927C1Q0_9GAMM|nr:cache domain-containing protein [Spongiibacter pelagi]
MLSLIALSAMPVAVLGYIWISTEYDRYSEQTEARRESYIESRRELLRREVNKASEYLEFRYSQLNAQLYNDLRRQIASAISFIENNRKQYPAEDARSQLTRLKSTLESFRFLNNKGFFYLFDGNGKPLLAPLGPGLEKRLVDRDALAAFASRLKGLKGEKNFDFAEFRINDPGSEAAGERNLSFIYYYQPLDVFIGSGVYLRDEVARVQQEVIKRIAAVPVDADNSVLFMVDQQGRQLVNALQQDRLGQVMPGVQEAARLAEGPDSSLFRELSWIDDQGRGKPVVAYLRRFEPWGWVVGSGVFLDELNRQLSEDRQELQNRVGEHVRSIVLLALGLMSLSALVASWLARRNAAGFRIFQQFFNDASQRSTVIDVERLPFAEFQQLASEANFMVAKRGETERALKLSERRFQLALDAAQNHLWDLDLTSGLVTVSDTFFRTLGYPALNKPCPVGMFKEVANPADLEIISSAVDSWLGLATGNSVEFRVRDSHGRYRWIYSRGDVVESDEAGEPTRAMGIMIDITDRKVMEQELVDARIAAEDALHAKSQFLSSVSHELRTPLNGVLGYAQLLQRDLNSNEPEGQEYLRGIESCGKHLLNLINDVLDLAKIESGNVKIFSRPNVLKEVLSSVSDIVAHRAKSKGLEFTVDVGANIPDKVQVDEVKLRQVLVNLLDNAVKFTERGSVRLDVRGDVEKMVLNFAVSDTGMGIPPNKLRDVFEPFRQVNPQDGKGTGLGLAICRRIIDAMGGQLRLQSIVGEGSCFYFEIPLIPVRDEEFIDFGAGTSAPQIAAQPVIPGNTGLSIIVADDVAVNRQVVIGMLSDIVTDIREAADGLEVIELLKERTADLVIMDLRMPNMDGMESTRIIKREMKLDDVVVIMASATTDEQVITEAREAGCSGFLPKPIGMDELFKAVAEISGLAMEPVAEPGAAPAATPKVAPVAEQVSEAVSNAIAGAVELGDISSLRDTLRKLRDDGTAPVFCQQAEAMLAQFDFDGLAALLKKVSV